ncbi:MAG: NUDIX hydrolase [Lutispora sp.]|jgi:8-oxo-dGTP pyrophosphatase MutT (NUDIX family)
MTGYIKEMRELIGNRPLLLVGTSVIAYRDGMILLQKRADNGEWGYPGGYLELGETVEESAQREFLEETGLIANRLELYGVFSGRDKHIVYPNGHEVYCVDVVFTCRDFSPSGAGHDDEVLELGWFPFTALPAGITPSIRRVLEQFIGDQLHCINGKEEPDGCSR